MQDRTWTWSRRLAAPASRVWPLIADTDRFNQAVGLPPVQFESVPHKFGFRRIGRFSLLGMHIAWDEYPFEFVEGERLKVLRVYHNGPLTELENTVSLEPDGDATILTHSIRTRARNPMGALFARYQIGFDLGRKIRKIHSTLESSVVTGANFYEPPAALDAKLRAPLHEALAGIDHGDLLLDYLMSAAAEDLTDIRPFRLARQFNRQRDELVTLFLYATQAGVLNAAWSLICPHCRGVQEASKSLKDLHFDAQHCPSCSIDFEASFDQLTELRFSLSPRWKNLETAPYCIGGPGRMPRAFAQFRVPPASGLTVPLSIPEGVYRFRAGGDNSPVVFEVGASGEPRVECALSAQGLVVSSSAVAPKTTLVFINTDKEERAVVLERTAWADDACTAAYVTTFQEFRDLFGSDVLAPGVAVKIATMAILFTDLKGSTALYQKAGDAPAFALVRDHFDRLIEVIARHNGAVVKTIGDAVMAAFLDPADAVRAALAMHTSVETLQSPDGAPVLLKIGLHAGPCFAVTLSDRLDYFGTTVNLAARIQSEALGGDVVIHESLAAAAQIRDILHAYPPIAFHANLKGIEGAQALNRYMVVTDAAPASVIPS